MNVHRAPSTAAVILLGICGALATPAVALAAQPVYRCGNAYADVPCPQAARVDVDDSRTAAQQAAAREVALREAALASRMAADRQREQVRPTPALRTARLKTPSSAASAPARPTPRSRTRFHQDNGQGDFVAFVPRKAKK